MMAMPGWQTQPPQPMYAQQAQPQQPTQWQAPRPPAVVRGVAAEVPVKFVMPRPEALGVATDLKLPTAHVDWNQIQARMERVGVVGYHKQIQPGAVRVSLSLATGGLPVEAQGETEAAAVSIALQQAEMQKR